MNYEKFYFNETAAIEWLIYAEKELYQMPISLWRHISKLYRHFQTVT